MPAESDFIDWLTSQQKLSPVVQRAAGDDLAILKWNSSDLLLVGIDQILDGVHFDSTAHSPRAIGRKAMNRNLSDCAAMACLPAAAVVSVALPKNAGIDYAKELYLGAKEAGDALDCPIVGGETGSWDGKLALTVSILGRSDGIEPITRAGAKPGDAIYVTGALGASLTGRHMSFEPRVKLARELASSCAITAMIDISDGLARDLAHICQEGKVAAIVDAAAIPIHDDAIKMRRDGHSPLDHALRDGEDYELLFTASRCDHPAVRAIGMIEAGEGMIILERGKRSALQPEGWEHSF
jgi:thiamine-monophosphate kinase